MVGFKFLIHPPGGKTLVSICKHTDTATHSLRDARTFSALTNRVTGKGRSIATMPVPIVVKEEGNQFIYHLHYFSDFEILDFLSAHSLFYVSILCLLG